MMGRIHCCGIDNVLQISRKLWKFICLCLFEYPRLSVRLLPLRLDSIPVDQFQFKEHREKSRKSKSKPFRSIFPVYRRYLCSMCYVTCIILIDFICKSRAHTVPSLKTIVTLRSYVSSYWRSQYRIGRKNASCKLAPLLTFTLLDVHLIKHDYIFWLVLHCT